MSCPKLLSLSSPGCPTYLGMGGALFKGVESGAVSQGAVDLKAIISSGAFAKAVELSNITGISPAAFTDAVKMAVEKGAITGIEKGAAKFDEGALQDMFHVKGIEAGAFKDLKGIEMGAFKDAVQAVIQQGAFSGAVRVNGSVNAPVNFYSDGVVVGSFIVLTLLVMQLQQLHHVIAAMHTPPFLVGGYWVPVAGAAWALRSKENRQALTSGLAETHKQLCQALPPGHRCPPVLPPRPPCAPPRQRRTRDAWTCWRRSCGRCAVASSSWSWRCAAIASV